MKRNNILLALVAIVAIAICCRSKSEVEMEQYYNRGELLYTQHCSNCHQRDGKGLGLLYPPLDKSDFMDQNFDEVLCIMKYGKTTPTVVNGKTYVQPMQGVSELTDLDIAEIATYIYNTWDHKKGMVRVTEVTEKMRECR
jgi:mono/diheme cytochrome c family protein